jgi:hypothetical protein
MRACTQEVNEIIFSQLYYKYPQLFEKYLECFLHHVFFRVHAIMCSLDESIDTENILLYKETTTTATSLNSHNY